MPGNTVGESFVTLLDWVLRWWIAGRDPGLSFVRDNVGNLQPVTRWLAASTLAVSIVTAAVVLMVRRRGQDLADFVLGLGRFLLVMSAGWLVFASGWTLSDAVSRWIIGGSPDISAYVAGVTQALADSEPALALTMSVFGLAAVLSFVAVVLVRLLAAVMLAVGVPVVAAASVARAQRGQRLVLAWVVALLAFRPLTSVLYRVSHNLVAVSDQPVLVLMVVPLSFIVSAALLPVIAHGVSGGAYG